MKKILIVDDEQHIRDLYAEEFRDLGYEVTAVPDGEQALSAVDGGTFDLAVLDMHMPGMSGIDTLRKMKERAASMPVIISSAYEEYKQDFASWASEAYVVKSSDLTALREAVRKAIG